jgi:arylformamidase
MKYVYDISLTISAELPVWPGDPKVILERVNKIENGANSNVSRLELSVHTGTHVDAPFHFLPGESTVESLSIDILTGNALVIELPDACGVIDACVVTAAGIAPGTQRVLFKTRNSRYWAENVADFQTGFVGVLADGAEQLVKLGVRLVGIDYLSISPYKNSRPTHEALLKAGVVIVEGLDLSQVPAGEYLLVCLPLKLKDSDGAPARAVLIKE